MLTSLVRQPASNFLKPTWMAIARESVKSVTTTVPAENVATPQPAADEPIKSIPKEPIKPSTKKPENPYLGFRFSYPEFLPDPDISRRNMIREKLERKDMLSRRQMIDIPEFYVGSILSVHYSDRHSQGKVNKFVGICIDRQKCGLRAQFVLRNCIDHQGIEIIFHAYDPTIQRIQVLRLEKRLDDQLYYLRDADEKYSTFDVDMEPEILPEGSEVPVNKLQIELKPRPWIHRWERKHLKGVINVEKHISEKMKAQMHIEDKPWEKYDLVKTYRQTIPEEEQNAIWSEVYSQLHSLELTRRKLSRKRTFVMPKKSG